MTSRNYTTEIGINSDVRRVPTAVTVAVVLSVVVLTLLFAREVNALNHSAKAPAELKLSSN